jgi:hypothetical protein
VLGEGQRANRDQDVEDVDVLIGDPNIVKGSS